MFEEMFQLIFSPLEQYPKLSRFQKIQKQQKPFHHSPQGPKKRKKLKHKEEVEVNFVPKKNKKTTKK